MRTISARVVEMFETSMLIETVDEKGAAFYFFTKGDGKTHRLSNIDLRTGKEVPYTEESALKTFHLIVKRR
jgi:hypothetical protein